MKRNRYLFKLIQEDQLVGTLSLQLKQRGTKPQRRERDNLKDVKKAYLTPIEMDRDRERDKQIEREIEKEIERQRDRWIEIYIYREREIEIKRQIDKTGERE